MAQFSIIFSDKRKTHIEKVIEFYFITRFSF